MWFVVALLGYFLLALVFVLDKRILTKNVSDPVVYAFYSTIFMFAAFFAAPFCVQVLLGMDMVLAIIAGLAFGFALWTMYIAVSKGEASHINPFIGGIVTVGAFILSSYFLGEKLTTMQLVGIGVLIVASFMLSFEKTLERSGIHIGYAWGALSGFLFAISHVSAKYIYLAYDFLTGFVWVYGYVGLVACFALLSPKVWKTFKKRKRRSRKSKDTVLLVTINKILGILGVVAIQYASSLGNTAPVFAMTGVQYAFMFVMIYFLTKCYPRLFKEYFTRKELVMQTCAIVLVVVGSALFVL